MKKTRILIAGLAVLAIGCSSGNNETAPSGGTTATKASAPTGTGAFASVQQLFTANCVGCHGTGNAKGGIDLSSYATVMKGGEDGPIVVAGDPDKSKIVDALRGRNGAMQMPKGKSPLPEEDIKMIETWIKDGAKES
jgi:cytochrome c